MLYNCNYLFETWDFGQRMALDFYSQRLPPYIAQAGLWLLGSSLIPESLGTTEALHCAGFFLLEYEK
jgi:hypothetical protein